MSYKDPERQREANRESARRRRAREREARSAPTPSEPPNRAELLRLLGVQARLGHVAAIRLLLEEYRRDAAADPVVVEEPRVELTPFDELDARRRANADG